MEDQKLITSQCTREELALIVDYLKDSDTDYLLSLGFAPEKLPPKEQFMEIMYADYAKPEAERMWMYLIWKKEGIPIGFTMLDNFTVGGDAGIHYHILEARDRAKGYGRFFLQESVVHFFEKFNLSSISADTSVTNVAGNRLPEILGFEFEKEHLLPATMVTNELLVNRWRISKDSLNG